MDWHLRAEGGGLVHETHEEDKPTWGGYDHSTEKCNRQTNCRRTDRTLIHVLVAGTSYKAGGTCANGAAIQGVGVAHRPLVARITHTCIIEVAQQTCGDGTDRHTQTHEIHF